MIPSAAPRINAFPPQMRDQLRRLCSGARQMNRALHARWWIVLMITGLGIMALLPAIIQGIPSGPDLNAHLRNVLSFSETVQRGDLYPGWISESNNGYGDAGLRVYPPGIYFLLTASHWLTAGNWYAATLLALTLLSIAGGLGAYFWASALCPRRYAVWASIFYIFAPFHINELYQSALIAEYAGGAVLAFTFGFLERVCQNNRTRDVVGLAASLAVLVFTHLPLTIMGSLALVLYALVRVERENFRQTAVRLALAAALAVAASASYWLTLITEYSWVKGDRINPGTRYNYALNFLFTTFSAENTRIWWVNIIGLAVLLMIWPVLHRSLASQAEAHRRRGFGAVRVLVVFSFLMTTALSWPLWAIIPKLGSIEFPWRWLAITSSAGAVAAAASIPFWMEKARTASRPLALLALGSVTIALVFTLAHPIRGAIYLARPQFDSMLPLLHGSSSLPDVLPIWSAESPRKMSGAVEAEGRAVAVVSWETERRTFQVGAGEGREARVRTFYYPHWVATAAGGVNLPTRPAADGALLISLPPEAVSVRLEFREPVRLQRVATIVSLTGWLLIGTLFVFSLRATRWPRGASQERGAFR